MGFFDEVERDRRNREDEEDPPVPASAPEWLEAPEDHLAGVVPLELLLARNEEAAVFIARIAAYRCGFAFEVHLFTKGERDYDGFEMLHRARSPLDELPDELLRLGVEFSDGRRAVSLGTVFEGSSFGLSVSDDAEPDPATDISLVSGGGGGSMRHTRTDYWVWPLPPGGPVRFVCQWPAFDIGSQPRRSTLG